MCITRFHRDGVGSFAMCKYSLVFFSGGYTVDLNQCVQENGMNRNTLSYWKIRTKFILDRARKNLPARVSLIILLIGGPQLVPADVRAQATSITPTAGAGSLGTTVTPAGNIRDIGGGTRIGRNLFHSFGSFSVGAGDTARFSSATGLPVHNILGRVTGPGPSRINGRIEVKNNDFSNTNLFLMNPAGVIFGAGSTLDISGSFHATTADYLKSANGNTLFYADPNRKSTLAAAPVTAFGFLESGANNSRGNIGVNYSTLKVSDTGNKSLSLIGREVEINNSALEAFGGAVNLAAMGSGGGEIRLDTSRGRASIVAANNPAGVPLTALNGRLAITDSSVNASPKSAQSDIRGRIGIWAGNTTLTNSDVEIRNLAGDIHLNVQNLTLEDGATITKSNNSDTSGTVKIFAQDSVNVSSSSNRISQIANRGSGTRSGIILINAKQLRVGRNGVIKAISAGPAKSGQIDLEVSELRITENGSINFETNSSGDGGQLTVRGRNGISAANEVRISGDPDDLDSGFSHITTQANSEGMAGTIDIKTRSLILENGAGITAESTLEAAGSPGNILIEAGHIEIRNRSRVVATNVNGETGGNIRFLGGKLVVDNHSHISTSTSGNAMGGNISVDVHDLTIANDSGILSGSVEGSTGKSGSIQILALNNITLLNRGSISVATATADAGNIDIDAGGTIMLDNDSRITTSAASGLGDGGNITIGASRIPRLLELQGGSRIVAQAEEGRGGDIDITTELLFQSLIPESIIDASSSRGIDGSVVIRSPAADQVTGPDPLPETIVDVSRLLPQRCGAGVSSDSRLVLHEGQGVPPVPDTLQASGFRVNGISPGSAGPKLKPKVPLFAGLGDIPTVASRCYVSEPVIR